MKKFFSSAIGAINTFVQSGIEAGGYGTGRLSNLKIVGLPLKGARMIVGPVIDSWRRGLMRADRYEAVKPVLKAIDRMVEDRTYTPEEVREICLRAGLTQIEIVTMMSYARERAGKILQEEDRQQMQEERDPDGFRPEGSPA